MTTTPTKLKAPSVKFDKALAAGKLADAIKAAGASKMGILVQAPVDAIQTIPGFNVRVESADYLQHRDEIAASIKANGFYPTMPLAGFVALEDGKHVLYLTGGHTRFDAVKTINADPDLPEEKEIKTVPMIVRGGESSLEDLTVALHTENDGNKLTPLELGTVVKRLLAFPNATQETVAARLGITARYLRDVLSLVDAPAPVKQAVLDGAVSSTFAIQTIKTKKDKAADAIADVVKKAKAGGKTKATAKDTKAKTVPMEKLEHKVSLATGTSIKDVLAAMAGGVRTHLGIPTGDGEITHDGEITITISRPKVTAEKVEKAAEKADTAKKASDAAIEAAAAAKKPAGKAPPRAKKGSQAPKATPKTESAPVEAPAGDDDELAILPPAVKDGPGVPEDDDGDI